MHYKTALLIGRFQPFHKGHLYLLKKALVSADKVMIGIGSANVNDENNPLDFETRKKIIKAVIYKEKIEKNVTKIVSLDDFHNDAKWLTNIKNKVGEFDLIIGNNEWTNKIMEKAGYVVKRFPYYKRNIYEGWRIRKLVKEGKKWQKRIPEYLIKFVETQFLKQSSQYNHVVIGGTFDHFHLGHQELINNAFKVGKKVTVGIATEKLYKKKFLSETVEPFKIRKKAVFNFIKKEIGQKRFDIVSFSEFTGGSDKNKEFDAIVVSSLTYLNALKINEMRKKNHLKPLKIFVIKDIFAKDSQLLSSERIRLGEIDRDGKLFALNITRSTVKELLLPETMREELRKPLGKVFAEVNKVKKFIEFLNPIMIVAVGDIIVESLLKEKIDPDIKIIDFKSRRKPIKTTGPVSSSFPPLSGAVGSPFLSPPVVNSRGTINFKTADKLRELIQESVINKKKFWLVIDGEEDLMTLPAILFAPLNSLILYGHWQYGIVGVVSTLEMKKKILEIISRFN